MALVARSRIFLSTALLHVYINALIYYLFIYFPPFPVTRTRPCIHLAPGKQIQGDDPCFSRQRRRHP